MDWIVMKCLEKDCKRRYQTTGGLGADIQRYLGDQPVEARPPSLPYRLRRISLAQTREAVLAGSSSAATDHRTAAITNCRPAEGALM
jgi:hypothetical protein